mmetsp:Transcript_5436/g.12284  ORF Transcript_5436/g.12284 Transcript_5436/m.12284 type:complete len:243 (-) Transcript_5436:557-1285(-)
MQRAKPSSHLACPLLVQIIFNRILHLCSHTYKEGAVSRSTLCTALIAFASAFATLCLMSSIDWVRVRRKRSTSSLLAFSLSFPASFTFKTSLSAIPTLPFISSSASRRRSRSCSRFFPITPISSVHLIAAVSAAADASILSDIAFIAAVAFVSALPTLPSSDCVAAASRLTSSAIECASLLHLSPSSLTSSSFDLSRRYLSSAFCLCSTSSCLSATFSARTPSTSLSMYSDKVVTVFRKLRS